MKQVALRQPRLGTETQHYGHGRGLNTDKGLRGASGGAQSLFYYGLTGWDPLGFGFSNPGSWALQVYPPAPTGRGPNTKWLSLSPLSGPIWTMSHLPCPLLTPDPLVPGRLVPSRRRLSWGGGVSAGAVPPHSGWCGLLALFSLVERSQAAWPASIPARPRRLS